MSSNAHKPSEKHTLDEVLKSLQDLMRGELLQDAPKPPPPPKPHYGKVGRPRKIPKPPAEQSAAQTTEAAGPVDVGAVLASLRSLVAHELADANGAESVNAPMAASDDARSPQAAPEDFPDSESESEDASYVLGEAESVTEALSEPMESVSSKVGETVTEAIEEPISEAPSSTSPQSRNAGAEGPATKTVSLEQSAAAARQPPDSSVPPEGLQQEFMFNASVSPAPDRSEALVLEFAPAPETRVKESSVRDADDATPVLEPEATQIDVAVNAGTADATAEAVDDTLVAPVDEIQAMLEEADNRDEEIVLEAPPPPEESFETTADVEIADAEVTPRPEPEWTISDLEPNESTEEVVIASAPDWETSDFPSAGDNGQKEEQPETPEDIPVAEGLVPPSEEVPAPEIEVAEAPGVSAGDEPPTSATPSGDTDGGKLGGHVELELGDLPVLQDVVVPPPAATQLNLIEPPLPNADRARELAVRVAARLNIERRKRGEPGIDTKTIHRLQQLLREELEKAGAKGENRRSK